MARKFHAEFVSRDFVGLFNDCLRQALERVVNPFPCLCARLEVDDFYIIIYELFLAPASDESVTCFVLRIYKVSFIAEKDKR